MKHKKSEHIDTVGQCSDSQCERSNDDCWFLHSPGVKVGSQGNSEAEKSVFQEVPMNAFPPDQMSKLFWMVTNLCNKVQNIEKKFEDLMI